MTLSHDPATLVENIKIEAISTSGFAMESIDNRGDLAECASTVCATSTIKLEDSKVLIKEEIISYKTDETQDNKELLSESIIAAQREAEEYAELADAEAQKLCLNAEDEALLPAPKLLQLSPSLLQEKTQSLKAKGQQLDLLLLKAESYSHFILENQRRSQAAEIQRSSDLAMMSPAAGKRKTTKSPSKSSKKTKGKKDSDSRSAEAELEAYDTATTANSSGGFCQPSNLVGGTLMPYQLEGLQWLLSLWENGLSGILAG
jgi:SNF2 family DNA or RNA helicase